MKANLNRALSLLSTVLLFAALMMPTVAYALEPNQIEVTVTVGDTVTADKAEPSGAGTYTGEDGATIEPDASDNGYTYTDSGESQTDVSLQGGNEDLQIAQGDDEPAVNTIPNSAVTGADGAYDQTDINNNDIYLGTYTGEGGAYTTDTDAFYDEEGDALSGGLPDSENVEQNGDMVDAILDSKGVEAQEGNEYLVVVGTTTISGDKQVQEVAVTDADGNVLEGYQVTLEANATRNDQIFDSEGGVTISGKTNIILTIDITQSMDTEFSGTDDTRWDVLKQAASEFIDTVYGVERDGSGNITNAGALNENIGLSLVVYSGGDNDVVARTVTVSGSGSAVFTNDDVTELLSYFTQSKTRTSMDDPEDMLANFGTNSQAGYMETADLVDALMSPSYGSVPAENIHVVFMTDGEANTYYANANDTTSSVSYFSGNTTTAGQKGADAAVALLEKGVSLHNVAINDASEANNVSNYMDPNKSGGYFHNKLDEADGVDDDKVDYSLFGVNYTWANTPEAIIETYRSIAQQIVNDAVVAQEARVIDVVPAGYDIYFVNGNTELKVVGTDAEGNTVIEWYIGDLDNGANYSTRYFLIPNSTMGGEYTYGTAYTNDSAILFAKPVANSGEEIAIVLDRPAIVIDPYADNDTVTENYNNDGFSFNLLNSAQSGASGGAAYNLLADSTSANKLQAVGTTVSDTGVTSVSNAVIAGSAVSVATDGAGGWVFENAQVRVNIAADGTVSYERLGAWPATWGNTVDITFDYEIGFTADGNGITLIGAADPAAASASITLQAPNNGDNGDGDDDDDEIPLNPGGSVVDDADIPLGVPTTGGETFSSVELILASLASAAALTLGRRKKNGN